MKDNFTSKNFLFLYYSIFYSFHCLRTCPELHILNYVLPVILNEITNIEKTRYITAAGFAEKSPHFSFQSLNRQ